MRIRERLVTSVITLGIASLLAACSGNESSGASPEPTISSDIEYFNTETYETAAVDTINDVDNADSLVGTWAGAWKIRATYSNSDAPDSLPESTQYVSRLDLFVIKRTGTDEYSISNCNNSVYSDITSISSTRIISGRGTYIRNADNSLEVTPITASATNEKYDLYFTQTQSGKFFKISNDVQMLGTLAGNWGDTIEIYSEEIVCAQLDNMEDSKHRVKLGLDNGELFNITQLLQVFEGDAYFNDADNEVTFEAAGGEKTDKYSLDVLTSEIRGFTFEYRMTEGTKNGFGTGTVSIILP